MKNKVTILTNLSDIEITPISISDLQNIVAQLPSGITVPNDSYGGFVPIHYNIDHDINFSAVKFYLNDELIHTSNKPTDTFNINVTTEFNKLSGYSVNRFDLKLPQTEFEVIFKTTLDQTKSPLQISKILKYNLPNFILDDYPVFVDFIEAYYQFLEKSNNPNLIHYNLENYKDIDSVPEYIVDYFRKELIPNFNLNLTKDRQTGESLNERVLIKHIKEFYDSKGTENSIKFLFRILFDKEATIFYPKVNLLKPSDGVWTIDKTIDVYGTDIVRLYGLVGTRIYQRKTTGEIESHAIIKNVNVKKIPGGFQGSLFLYELSGTFSNTTAILLKEVLDGVSVETPLTVIKISNKNLTISSGRRDSLGGNLSETKRLIPDNDYWQNASYDVQGDADPKSFISIIKKLAHPAGFKIFASYSPTLKLSKTINIKNEVLTSNSFGSPKTFLNDLISKTDSLDILLVGDSNIHFGGQDGGYMYGWSYTLDELGVPCYSTPLFPSLTRSLATFAGASGIFKYFPGANTSTNAEYDASTKNYWWKSNTAFGGVTGYLVKNDTWVGSTVSDTYATWINNIWKCGTPSGTKTTSGWHTFNSLVDWAYIKPGVLTSYDSARNINIAKTGFIDSNASGQGQTAGSNKIYGLNPAWYGNFPVEKELNYRNVNVKFPGTNGGSIYLTSRNATNVSGSATPSYYGSYSTDSGSTTEYKIQADVLTILADSSRKYVDAAWQGAHNGNFGKGPIATLLESVSVKNQKGYAVNSFHARGGHTAQNIASGLEAAGIESIKIYLKEIRDRQISSGGSGRVLIFVNMGVNSNGGIENALFGDRAERIIVSISTAWSALGYPKSDLGFLISNSHNGGDPYYTNPTAVIATAEYLKNKYSNVMLVNFDNDSLGSVTRLTNILGYINGNSVIDSPSTGNTNPQVHLSQGRNVVTGTTTKTPNGEGGYAAIISGLINTVKTSSFTSPVTSTTTDNSTVNNTQENTTLTIGNYLAYSSDTVQDLNFLKTDNIDDDTDISSTYRAFPDGLPFGVDGKTPTPAAKSYISLIQNVAATNAAQLQPVLLIDDVYFKPNIGILPGVPENSTTVNGKLTSVIKNIGQLLEGEEVSEKWQCGVHPRSILNPTEQIFSPDAAFGDLKISHFVGEEDPRSDIEKQKSTTTCGSCVQYNKEHADLLDMIKKNEKIIQDLHDQADTDLNAACAWCWIGFTYDLLTSVVSWIAFNWLGAAFVALGVFKTTVTILSKTTSYVYTEFAQVWNGQCWRTVRNTVTRTVGPEFNSVKLAEFFTVKKISRTGLQNAVNTGEASSLWENLCTLGRIWDVRTVKKLIKKKNVIRTFETSEKQWWPSDYRVLPKPIQNMQITRTVIKPHALQKIVCDPTTPSGRRVVYEWISEWQVIDTPSTEFALWKAENWLLWRNNIRYANVSTVYDSTINKMHWIDVPTALNASQMQLRETVIEFVGFSKRWFANILVAGFGTGSSVILWWFTPSFMDCMDRGLADWVHSTDAIFMLEKRAIANQYDEAARICAAYPECCKGGGFIGSGSGSGSASVGGGGGGGGSGGSNQNNPMILENGIGLDLLDIIEEIPVTLNDNTTERLVESSIIKDNIQLNSKYMIDALSPNIKSIEYLNRDERYLFTGSESYQDCIAASLENYNNGSLSANIPDKMKVLLNKTDSDLFIDLSVDLYNFITSIDKNEYALLLSKTPNMLDFIIKWLGLIDNNYAYTNSLDKIIKFYTNNIKFRQLCYPDRGSQGKKFTIKHSLTGLDIQSIQEVLRNTSVDKIKNYLNSGYASYKMEELAYWSKDRITPQSVDSKFPIGPPSYGTSGFDGLRSGSFLWPTLSKEFNFIETNYLYSPTMVNSADLTKNVSTWLKNCYSYLNLSTFQLLDLCYVRLTPGFHVSDWNTVMQNENLKRPSFKCINNTQLQEQHPIIFNMSISKNSFAPSFFADKRDYIFMGDQGCCESNRFVRWLEPTAASNFYFKHIKQIFRVYTDVRIKYIRDLMIYNFKDIKPDLIVGDCRNAHRCENDGDSNSVCYKEYTYTYGDGDSSSIYKSTLIPENRLNEFFEGLCSKINNSYTKLSDEIDKISKIATDLGIALGTDDQKCRTKFKDTVYDKCVASKPSSGAPKGLNLL